MSLYLGFEPNGWYGGFALQRPPEWPGIWHGYTLNGMSGYVDILEATSLKELKHAIQIYNLDHQNGYGMRYARFRLRILRRELRDGHISSGELSELQNLIPFIDASDVELLEAAGVPEFKETE